MALEKTTLNDKLEIIDMGSWKSLQIRTATIIKDDGEEISRAFSTEIISSAINFKSEKSVSSVGLPVIKTTLSFRIKFSSSLTVFKHAQFI